MKITFGTDGWRGIIGYDFTAANIQIVAQALADYMLTKNGEPSCVVGYDTRFMSDRFADEVAAVLAGNGIKVFLSEKPVTSPVLSFSAKNLSATGGVMVTASHNPPSYNGIKFKGAYGGSALPEVVKEIESQLSKNAAKQAPSDSDLIRRFNPDTQYIQHLLTLIDPKLITNSGLKVCIDSMYGSAQGYFTDIFGEQSFFQEIRNSKNPDFGGVNPEPIEKNLDILMKTVKENGFDVGLAFDGDGDRIGAVTADGVFVNSHQIFALLLTLLVEHQNMRGEVVKTFSTSRMIDKLAELYHLPLHETPIGFKYICDLFLSKDILIGGEESGGIGVKNHLPERDGILCGLYLLELMARTGQSLTKLLSDLAKRIGNYEYGRVDLKVKPESKDLFTAYMNLHKPDVVAGEKVAAIQTLDGIKLLLANGAWLLFRFSGTEPVLRLYAEAPTTTKVEELLSFARDLVQKRI